MIIGKEKIEKVIGFLKKEKTNDALMALNELKGVETKIKLEKKLVDKLEELTKRSEKLNKEAREVEEFKMKIFKDVKGLIAKKYEENPFKVSEDLKQLIIFKK